MRILYDGWPLVHSPLSPSAWHLRTLLALNPEGIYPFVALPTEEGNSTIEGEWEPFFFCTQNRAAWEQRILPRLAEEHQVNLIHTTGPLASLFGRIPTLVSPAEMKTGARSRLGEALGRGGLARATILWPADLPESNLPGEVNDLPPVVHPKFTSGPRNSPTKLGLPEEFLLVDGIPDEEAALQLLESWTWAAASIGEYYPLVIIGLDQIIRTFICDQSPKFHIQKTLRVPDDIQPKDLDELYKTCSAMVHLGSPAPWGNPLRHALATGKAIVAQQDVSTEAIVGSAGYLISPTDLRGFGAAMITVVVDEKVREKLEAASQARAGFYSATKFKERLLQIYEGKT